MKNIDKKIVKTQKKEFKHLVHHKMKKAFNDRMKLIKLWLEKKKGK